MANSGGKNHFPDKFFAALKSISKSVVRDIALSLPEVIEAPHFHLISFRVRKKIFCTIHEADQRIMVKLNPVDQSVFCVFDPAVIYPVPGAWGKKGATFISLSGVRKDMLRDAIRAAYCTVAPPKLAAPYILK